MQGRDEFVKTAQARSFDLLDPELKATLGGGLIRGTVEDRRQQGAQHRGAGQGGRLLE